MRTIVAAIAVLLAAETAAPAQSNTFPVHIQVNAAQTIGPLHSIWRFFGADEPNYAYMANGKKLIGELGRLRGEDRTVFFRAHNLLTSGDGTPALKWGSTGAYREDADGQPIYNWAIVDRIFDTYRRNGVRPYVEIGFVPKELSTAPANVPYQHDWNPNQKYKQIFTGWTYPPKDYAKWGELVYQWVKHDVEKYGADEVNSWYWETWNEANIPYWHGTAEEFFKLHDYAVDAVRRALPTAKVGGPDMAGSGEFLTRFLEHCVRGTNFATGKIGTPTDFISFHAKGAPTFVDGHVRMGIRNQLQTMDDAFRRIAAFPELKDKPIVIGESDPDGCAACLDPQYGYRNGALYASYTAATFGREQELSDLRGVNLEGALTWAFEFEDQPLFAGYRVLATGGIDLPVLNTFRMFNKMSGQRVVTESDSTMPLETILQKGVRGGPDVSAFATLDANKLCVLVWHYQDDDLPGPDAEVTLNLTGLPSAAANARVHFYRVDNDHGNPFGVWEKMGSPPHPTPSQYAELQAAGQLAEWGPPQNLSVKNGNGAVVFPLPQQAVCLVTLDW